MNSEYPHRPLRIETVRRIGQRTPAQASAQRNDVSSRSLRIFFIYLKRLFDRFIATGRRRKPPAAVRATGGGNRFLPKPELKTYGMVSDPSTASSFTLAEPSASAKSCSSALHWSTAYEYECRHAEAHSSELGIDTVYNTRDV